MTVKKIHKCIPLAVGREAQWLIDLTTDILTDTAAGKQGANGYI